MKGWRWPRTEVRLPQTHSTGGEEEGAGLCLVVLSARTRGSGHRLEPREFCVSVRKSCVL